MQSPAPNPFPWGLLAGLLFLLLTAPAAACRGQSVEQPATSRRATSAAVEQVKADTGFARLIARFSEPSGYFDTDNLISNETSYLHVLGALRKREVRGGAYLGVGPDQNFSYIAQIRPEIAFILDIRRDNLLQHLFFKALFARAPNRLAFLCYLVGKPLPDDLDAWAEQPVEQLIAYIDAQPAAPAAARAVRQDVLEAVQQTGVPLAEGDLETIGRIHAHFIDAGLDLRFTSHNQPPRSYYPTYRQLLLERDLTGRQGNYLASEDDFQFLRKLQAQNRIIPVVGDLAGGHALPAIGAYLTERNLPVSAFYTSNVEFYLMRDGSFDQYAEHVERLPHDANSLFIRCYFNRYSAAHPQTVPGYASTQLLQTMSSFVQEQAQRGYRSYYDLINKHVIDLR